MANDNNLLGKLRYYYQLYQNYAFTNKLSMNQTLLEAVAIRLSYGEGRGQDVLGVMRNMTENGYVPTFQLVKAIMLGNILMLHPFIS